MSSWSLLFRAIKLYYVPRLPLNEQTDKLFFDSDFPDIYYKLIISCRKATEEHLIIMKKKEILINKARDDIAMSAWLVVISLVLIILLKST